MERDKYWENDPIFGIGDLDVDELLADARLLTADPEPPSERPEERSMDEMAEQVRVLTEEVSRLRARLDESPPEQSSPPSGQGSKSEKTEPKKQNRLLETLSNLLFYAVIIGVVLGAFLIKSGGSGRPTMIAGYSAFTVLTSSMEDVYPKGSLIITKSVDANDLHVGDDITFMVSETSSITHRIIGIEENYLDTGERAFETQGVMNENADKEPAAAANVVGKVIFCSPGLGKAASFTRKNWPMLAFATVVIVALVWFLKWNAGRDDSDDPKEKKAKPGKKPEEAHKEKTSARR